MRLPQLLLVTGLLALAGPTPAPAAPRTGYERAMAPYFAALRRQCPDRRLEDLTAGDLDLILEDFEATLPRARQGAIRHSVDRACVHSVAGLGCPNTAAIRAVTRMGLGPRLAAAACRAGWRCTGFGECRQAPAG